MENKREISNYNFVNKFTLALHYITREKEFLKKANKPLLKDNECVANDIEYMRLDLTGPP